MTVGDGVRRLRIFLFIVSHLASLASRRVRGVSKRAKVTEADINANPHTVWNKFVDLIATSFEHELTPRQRLAQLVFRYESEVQNGGHLQFFLNSAGEDADETVAALDALGAGCQARVLEQAAQVWRSAEREPLSSHNTYSHVASKGEFRGFDAAFSDCPVPLIEVLERHLAEHETEYIVRR